MELTKLSRILDLARAHAVEELELVYPTGRVRFTRGDAVRGSTLPHASRQSVAPHGTPYEEALRLAELHESGRLHLIRAQSVGVFSWVHENGESPLALGIRVAAGGPVGAIKALGLRTTITAPVAGVVAAVYVREGDPVQYGHYIVGIEI